MYAMMRKSYRSQQSSQNVPYSQSGHSLRSMNHVFPARICSKISIENSSKVHEAVTKRGNEMRTRGPLDARSNRYSFASDGLLDVKFERPKNSLRRKISVTTNPETASISSLVRSAVIPTAPVSFHISSESILVDDDKRDGTLLGGKIDVATETIPGWFVQRNIDSSHTKSHPSTSSNQRLISGVTESSVESLSETFEAVLESLRRSLKKRRQSAIFGRAVLTNGVSVAVRKFNPSYAYEKLPLKRFKDERNFVEQKLNTFARVSDLGLGRKSIKVSDLKCCKYFYESYILHECRVMGLQRPKKKPLQEYYNDDDAELEGTFLFFIFGKR